MLYNVQNTRGLSSEELLNILCKSAKLYSGYADITLFYLKKLFVVILHKNVLIHIK